MSNIDALYLFFELNIQTEFNNIFLNLVGGHDILQAYDSNAIFFCLRNKETYFLVTEDYEAYKVKKAEELAAKG